MRDFFKLKKILFSFFFLFNKHTNKQKIKKKKLNNKQEKNKRFFFIHHFTLDDAGVAHTVVFDRSDMYEEAREDEDEENFLCESGGVSKSCRLELE